MALQPRGRGRFAEAASRWLGACAVVLGALAFVAPDVNGSDLWWHLASGREIWEQGGIPRTDPFSHTAAGRPWTNHAWLWGWIAWPVYHAQPNALAALNFAIVAGIFSLVAWNCWRASRCWLATGAITWLAAAASHWFLDVRPHLVTLLFSALLMATLDWRRAAWLWPPLMALWANLHGGFLFGLGLIGLHVLVRSTPALLRREWSSLPRAPWIGLALAALAIALNPWGFEIYGLPFEPLQDTPFRTLVEWRPPAFELDPRSYAGRFAWLAIAAGIGAIQVRRAPFAVALAAVTLLMSLFARRFVPLFAVAGAPLAALGLGLLLAPLGRRLPPIGPKSRLLASGAALLLALLMWNDVRWLPRPLQRWTQGEWYPSGAAAYLDALPEPPRRLFNSYEWGGYLALTARRVPIFIDGRAGTVYDDDVARDYHVLVETAPGWPERLAGRQIDAALLERGSPLAVALRRQSPAWRVAHVDPRSVLLFPPAEDPDAALPAPRQLIRHAADLQLAQAIVARWRGDRSAAADHLRAVLRSDPLQLFAYQELALISAQQGDAAGVEHWIEQARRVYPRRRNFIWSFAEQAWNLMANRTGQLEALRKLDANGPFIGDEFSEQIRARIRALESARAPAPSAQPADSGRWSRRVISATMETAISAGDSAAMSRPTGP